MTASELVREPPVTLRAQALKAYLALAAGVLCIGFTAIFTKWAAMPGPASSAFRMATAGLLLAVPLTWQLRQKARRWTPGISWAVLGGVWFALNIALLSSGLLLTSAANATLLDNTAPIWVGFGALLLFKERLRVSYWLGLLTALGGAAVVTGLNPLALGDLNRGDVLAFTGALFYALYLLTTQKARRSTDALSYLWVVVVTAALVLVGLCLTLGMPLTGYPANSYLVAVGSGIISQSAGWWLINYALGYLPASSAVMVLLAQPVVTGLLSIPLLGESISVAQVAGGALVLGGIYLCLRANALR